MNTFSLNRPKRTQAELVAALAGKLRPATTDKDETRSEPEPGPVPNPLPPSPVMCELPECQPIRDALRQSHRPCGSRSWPP